MCPTAVGVSSLALNRFLVLFPWVWNAWKACLEQSGWADPNLAGLRPARAITRASYCLGHLYYTKTLDIWYFLSHRVAWNKPNVHYIWGEKIRRKSWRLIGIFSKRMRSRGQVILPGIQMLLIATGNSPLLSFILSSNTSNCYHDKRWKSTCFKGT